VEKKNKTKQPVLIVPKPGNRLMPDEVLKKLKEIKKEIEKKEEEIKMKF
jgi:hypothetical protein